MNRFIQIALTWIAFIAMFSVNALANYLPINGFNTGEISAFYPNKFVPDGITFSIWSVIYLWILVFVGYSTSILIWLPNIDHRYDRIVSILPLFWLSCLLNALWIITWHYLYVSLSVLVMVCLLITLIFIFLRFKRHPAHPRKQDHQLVEIPFIIYLGWISVATIANITALLVHFKWNGTPLTEATWAIIMILIALALGIWMSYKQHRPTYSLVLCWAFWGIFRAQEGIKNVIGLVALVAIVTSLGFAIPELLHPKRGWKEAS
jgi:hypothetical protein